MFYNQDTETDPEIKEPEAPETPPVEDNPEE